ncbi:MAG: FxsA family protein [Rhodobacteraceae bacterium]|jgi:UPF0716 protein FxsA|nr:FxsA family protein [Paracoccaceae bacterium]
MWVGAAFLVLPLVEIALFVVVGGWIGLWSTLAVVIGSGILGVTLLRRMGAPSLGVVRGDLLSPLAERALLAVAAMLLILPGFLTDTLGLILLLPAVRRLVVAQLAARLRQTGAGRRADETVIDGEFYEIEPETRELRPPSGWTRH